MTRRERFAPSPIAVDAVACVRCHKVSIPRLAGQAKTDEVRRAMQHFADCPDRGTAATKEGDHE